MEDVNYYIFILGYDLLHKYFSNSSSNECDIVYDKCKDIIRDFINSKEYKNYNYSAYDSLVIFLKNKKYL